MTNGSEVPRMRVSIRSIAYASVSVGWLGWFRQHPVVVFFVLAFAFTWAIEIPMLAFQVAPLQFVVGWMRGRTSFHAYSTRRSHRELGT